MIVCKALQIRKYFIPWTIISSGYISKPRTMLAHMNRHGNGLAVLRMIPPLFWLGGSKVLAPGHPPFVDVHIPGVYNLTAF